MGSIAACPLTDTSLACPRVIHKLDSAARSAVLTQFLMCYGTELTSMAILRWSQERAIAWHDIAPGKPMQNGFVESFSTDEEFADLAVIMRSVLPCDISTHSGWTRWDRAFREGGNMNECDLTATRNMSFTASGELPLLLGGALVRTESFEAMRRTPQSSQRLRRMMQRTGIDRVPAARAVEVLAALHVTCADCPNVQQCALWQSAGGDDAGIRSFCPNAPTFEALCRISERLAASMRDAIATRIRQISREVRDRAKREADARLRQLVASHALALAQCAECIEREIAINGKS